MGGEGEELRSGGEVHYAGRQLLGCGGGSGVWEGELAAGVLAGWGRGQGG